MSQDDLFGAPAGWYPDPLGLPQLRWWNNHAWTEQTAAARQPMVVQDTKFAWADDEPATAPEELRRDRGDRAPTAEAEPTADTLRQLEPPTAAAKIDQNTQSAPAYSAPQPEPTPAADPFAGFAPQPTPSTPEPQNPYAESAKWWETRGTDTRRAASAAASAATASSEPVANPFMQPVTTPESSSAAPTFTSLFDAQPTAPASTFAANADSLEALFGSPTAATRSRVRTPIVSSELFEATAPASKASTNTGPVWVVAVLPVLQLVVGLLLITTFGMGINTIAYDGVFLVAYLAGVLLAYFDRRTLVAAGFERPAHWAFAFATPFVYLILRARATLRDTGHGIGPLLVWIGLAVLALVSVVAIPGQLIAAVPTVFAQQIEQSVQTDAATLAGASMTVECPATPPVLPGEEITCSSTTPDGKTNPVIVTLQRSNGWISWQVIDWGVYQL